MVCAINRCWLNEDIIQEYNVQDQKRDFTWKQNRAIIEMCSVMEAAELLELIILKFGYPIAIM